MSHTINFNNLFRLVYDDPGDGGDGGDDGNNDSGNRDSGNGDLGKTFTQEQVNDIIQKRLAKDRQKYEQQATQLEELRKAANLTKEQRDALEAQIEELQTQAMTKEQLAEREKDKLRKAHDEKITQLQQDADTWKNRFTESTIQRAMTDAASKHGAWNNEQVAALLRVKTRLVEVKNEDGEPTGDYMPRVKLDSVDKNGQPTTLDLTVEEAVAQMKEMEQHANLFKGTATGGLGGSTNRPGTGKGNLEDIFDVERYLEYRKKRGVPEINSGR